MVPHSQKEVFNTRLSKQTYLIRCIDQRWTVGQSCPFPLILYSWSQGKILYLGVLSWHGCGYNRYDCQGRNRAMAVALRCDVKQLGCVLELPRAVTGFSLLLFSVFSCISLRLVSQSPPPLRWLTQNWYLLLVDLFAHTWETGPLG